MTINKYIRLDYKPVRELNTIEDLKGLISDEEYRDWLALYRAESEAHEPARGNTGKSEDQP